MVNYWAKTRDYNCDIAKITTEESQKKVSWTQQSFCYYAANAVLCYGPMMGFLSPMFHFSLSTDVAMFQVFNLPLFVCVFQGWVMAVRWLFYTPASITLWYWPGRFSISSSLLTLNFPGRVAETAGTQVCYQTKWTSIKGSTCSDSGVHAMFSQRVHNKPGSANQTWSSF